MGACASTAAADASDKDVKTETKTTPPVENTSKATAATETKAEDKTGTTEKKEEIVKNEKVDTVEKKETEATPSTVITTGAETDGEVTPKAIEEVSETNKASAEEIKAEGDASKKSGDASKESGDASKESGDASKESGDATEGKKDAETEKAEVDENKQSSKDEADNTAERKKTSKYGVKIVAADAGESSTIIQETAESIASITGSKDIMAKKSKKKNDKAKKETLIKEMKKQLEKEILPNFVVDHSVNLIQKFEKETFDSRIGQKETTAIIDMTKSIANQNSKAIVTSEAKDKVPIFSIPGITEIESVLRNNSLTNKPDNEEQDNRNSEYLNSRERDVRPHHTAQLFNEEDFEQQTNYLEDEPIAAGSLIAVNHLDEYIKRTEKEVGYYMSLTRDTEEDKMSDRFSYQDWNRYRANDYSSNMGGAQYGANNQASQERKSSAIPDIQFSHPDSFRTAATYLPPRTGKAAGAAKAYAAKLNASKSKTKKSASKAAHKSDKKEKDSTKLNGTESQTVVETVGDNSLNVQQNGEVEADNIGEGAVEKQGEDNEKKEIETDQFQDIADTETGAKDSKIADGNTTTEYEGDMNGEHIEDKDDMNSDAKFDTLEKNEWEGEQTAVADDTSETQGNETAEQPETTYMKSIYYEVEKVDAGAGGEEDGTDVKITYADETVIEEGREEELTAIDEESSSVELSPASNMLQTEQSKIIMGSYAETEQTDEMAEGDESSNALQEAFIKNYTSKIHSSSKIGFDHRDKELFERIVSHEFDEGETIGLVRSFNNENSMDWDEIIVASELRDYLLGLVKLVFSKMEAKESDLSVLLVGHEGCGKKTIMKSLAVKSDAYFFDFSAHARLYTNWNMFSLEKVLSACFKLQPCILYIDFQDFESYMEEMQIFPDQYETVMTQLGSISDRVKDSFVWFAGGVTNTSASYERLTEMFDNICELEEQEV